MDADYIIIGGGVVGLSVAWGLVRQNHRVLVLDGSDGDHRASKGNFGLVWVQGKGLSQPKYAQWSIKAARSWRSFCDDLEYASDDKLALQQIGGYDLHFSEDTLSQTVQAYEKLKAEIGDAYPYEVLDAQQIRKHEPELGPAVCGGILHYDDGHVNPLRLLKALSKAFVRNGGQLKTAQQVMDVEKVHGAFFVKTKAGETYEGGKVVLAAGLGSAMLGPKLGFKAPLTPLRGQNLITEKLPPIMKRPSLIARQVNEGGIQIGDSKEPVGFDDSETVSVMASMAARAVKTYPIIAKAKLVRSWGCLRVMTPDGLPIYQKSNTVSGAFLVTCHSGITLASNHSNLIPQWLENTKEAPNLEFFNEDRF